MPAPPPFIGVDLGGTKIQVGVVDAKDNIVGRARTKTRSEDGLEAVIDRVAGVVREALQEAGLKPGDAGGVGIGAPGTVDVKKGIVLNAVNLRWNHVPLAELLGKQVNVPVYVENDVNVGTWGEYALGAGQKFDDLLGIFVGTGIGGGLVLNGELYQGGLMGAGEIGHTIIHADAPVGRQTLENSASRTAVANLIAQLIRSNHPSVVAELTEGKLDEIRSKVLTRAVEQGDPMTRRVVRQSARYVGIAVANAVMLLSLPCVVVGGGLPEALGEQYVKWVRTAFTRHVFTPEMRKCAVLLSQLGDDAGVYGAALLARKQFGGKTKKM